MPYLVIISNRNGEFFGYGLFPDALAANAWARKEENLGHIGSKWEICPYLPIPMYRKMYAIK